MNPFSAEIDFPDLKWWNYEPLNMQEDKGAISLSKTKKVY